MTQAMIGAPPKRSLTTAQRRLRKADPALAAIMDEFAVEMDQTLNGLQDLLDAEYDLAAYTDPAPSILRQEETLALELGRFSLAMDPMLEIADKLKGARDEAYMVLGRVEQLIAQRTLDAMQLTPQAALPPPPDPFDGGDDTEDFHDLPATMRRAVTFHPGSDEHWDADDDAPTVPLATKVGRWWTRVRGWGRRQFRAATTSATLALRGWA